jgi:hypothetical protein
MARSGRRGAVVVGALAALLACAACGSFGSAGSEGAADAAQASDGGSLDALVEEGSLAEVGPPGDAGDAGSDAPFVPTLPCGVSPDCERIVFVTSNTMTGKLGGTAGADAQCNQLAANATDATKALLQGRVFTAWLSTSTVAAKDRLVHGTKAYRLIDGTVIANDWNDLVDGTIAAPINVTESAAVLPLTTSATAVWTGTLPSGGFGTNTCTGWTVASGANGAIGHFNVTTTQWTSPGDAPCGEPGRLYCFEH